MKAIEWGYLIIIYLFLGGLSAGLFFVSAIATFAQKPGETAYCKLTRWSAFLAPWPVALGSALLVLDLGKWYRFYKLFLHFHAVSPMSVGAWLLGLFTLISLLYGYAWMTDAQRARFAAHFPRAIQRLFAHDLDRWRRKLAAAGYLWRSESESTPACFSAPCNRVRSGIRTWWRSYSCSPRYRPVAPPPCWFSPSAAMVCRTVN